MSAQMKKIRPAHGPEWAIQRDVIKYLRSRGWWVERLIGNAYQKGIPDLLIAHPKFGIRFIDVKNPVAWEYTKAQCQKWPVWQQYNIGVWILTAASEEEYNKLFREPNWRHYWKPRYDAYLMDVDVLLAELLCEENKEIPIGLVKNTNTVDITQETDLSWLNENTNKQ
jgi:hypothetical protein